MTAIRPCAVAAFAIALLAGSAQAATLVFDDFEGYGPLSITDFTGFDDLTVGAGTVDFVREPDFGLSTPTGSGMVDLDGAGSGEGGLLTAEFFFQAGDVITLEFDASGNQRRGSDVWGYGFSFAGLTSISDVVFSTPDKNGGPGGPTDVLNLARFESTAFDAAWGHYSFSFKAQQIGSFTAFLAMTGDDDLGVLVDNVRLSRVSAAVPEPSAWALMILGCGGVGAALRRARAAPGARAAA